MYRHEAIAEFLRVRSFAPVAAEKTAMPMAMTHRLLQVFSVRSGTFWHSAKAVIGNQSLHRTIGFPPARAANIAIQILRP